MQIFIPTRGRFIPQHTIKSLYFGTVNHGYPLTVVVPECEKMYWDGEPYNIVTVPDCFTSGQIRQWINDNYMDDPHHVCIDDDLKFFRRLEGTTFLDKVTPENVGCMFRWIETQFKAGYVHGGISAREGNNHRDDLEVVNTRVMRCLFYNAAIMLEQNIRWDSIKCRMDFHVTLSLMEAGYSNIVNFDFAHNQNTSGMAKSGAGHYRSLEMMNEQAHVLQTLHPDFVKTKEKTTKSSFGGGTRTAVMIQWKKAYKSSQTDSTADAE